MDRFIITYSLLATFSLAAPTTSSDEQSSGPGWPSSYNPVFSPAWGLKNFTTLITFGDSYTDDSRANYFFAHNGEAPPVDWIDPANYASADGGRPWPQYVKQYAGVKLYNYAVSGAVCSNEITPRSAGTFLFPDVDGYEVPAYFADAPDVSPDTTVYSLWIGTNDLGVNALLTDSQVPGTSLVNYTDCVFAQLRRLYDFGGRHFVLQNLAPLNLAPLYALPGQGGVGANQYWPDKPDNLTKISSRMREQVLSANAIYRYQTPYALNLAKHFPRAQIVVMDMHGLITDIYQNPSDYLNGTAPLNVTGYANHCNVDRTGCVTSPSPDSFLWYDELHPSEQVDRVIAKEFLAVVAGRSRWVVL